MHRRNGVTLQFGVSVDAIDASDSQCTIHIGGTKITADAVAVGIGAIPNVDLAEEAGLAVDDGIVVDQFERTSDPNIFAAGDVTNHFNPLLDRAIRLEAWQNVQNQATTVGGNVAGGSKPFAEVPWLWTDQYDMDMQVAGAPLRWDQLVYRGDSAGKASWRCNSSRENWSAPSRINAARDMRIVRMLVASRKTVDAGLLADEKDKMQDLCR